jgi:hypothetical protein
MNTITIIVTILTLWLIMGLGFLAEYVEAHRNGKTLFQALKSYEGVLFVLSVVLPLIIILFRASVG